ncbi:MAG: insulinase family protein [Bacilli bacterium]|nr:insulinase family protein [Bacilli bacterium]
MNLNIPKRPIIIKNEDFQTIIVRVMFPFYDEEEYLTKMTILPNLLMYMNNKYQTEDEFQKNRKKNYILSTTCNKMTVGTNMCLCFSLVIPDTDALGFDHLEEQFSFFSEMIYNPKIIDGGFDKNEVEREKKNLDMSIENAMKNLRPYQTVKGLELIDDEGILSASIENHREQLEDVNPQSMYELYNEIINAYHPAVFVFGNVDDNKINGLIDKYIYKKLSDKYVIEKRYNHFLKPLERDVNFVTEKKDFKDSSISFYYKIKDYVEDDFKKLSLVRGLLSSLSSRMLNKKLRDENDLVYSSKAVAYLRFGVFEITAYINKDNKDIVIEKIKEVMEDIKNPDNIREYLDNIKDRRRIALIKSLDDKFTLLNDAVLETLEVDKNMYDDYEDVLKITAEDVSKFSERLVLDTIYFIEEDEHE